MNDMHELQLVRDFFGEQPPPDPDMVAAAKERMFAGGPVVRRRFAGRRFALRSLPARPHGLLLRLGVPAAAAAAAVAVTAALMVQWPVARKPAVSGSVPAVSPGAAGIAVFRLPAGAAVGGAAGSGRDILLTAARTAAKSTQPAPERYYVTPGVVGNFVRVGPPGKRYLVLEMVNRQYWAATNPRDGSPDMSQARYVRAASPADEAAWRRDGSPRVWKDVGQETGLADPVTPADGWSRPLSMAPGKLTALTAAYGAQPFNVGDKSLSLRQLKALPADPAKLKALLLAGWSGYSSEGTATSYLFQTVPAVLEMPVTSAVRSALYKLLASLPGVQSIGAVTDIAGRQGVAVAYTARYSNCGAQIDLTSSHSPDAPLFSSCTVQQVLIIGPDDGMPLAEELRYTQLPAGQHWSAPDGLFSYEVFGTPYWTNHDRPSRPKD
jgi:hypothetical protein